MLGRNVYKKYRDIVLPSLGTTTSDRSHLMEQWEKIMNDSYLAEEVEMGLMSAGILHCTGAEEVEVETGTHLPVAH